MSRPAREEDEAEREFEEGRKKSLLDTAQAHSDLPMMAYPQGWRRVWLEMGVLGDVREARPADALMGGTRRIRSLRYRRRIKKAEGRTKEERVTYPSSQSPSTGENSSAKIAHQNGKNATEETHGTDFDESGSSQGWSR